MRQDYHRKEGLLLSKNLTKTCRGKVMKEKLKSVKHDSSFFIPNFAKA